VTEAPRKNVPVSTPLTEPFWEACRRHELLIQHCGSCGAYQFYPRTLCTACGAAAPDWARASGQAQVKSFTIVRRAVSEAYAADAPYVVALVELAEGPTLMTNIVGCAPEDVAIGMAVEVAFDDWPEGVTVPKFRPIGVKQSP
jgi:uncharacterized OB-fold protein